MTLNLKLITWLIWNSASKIDTMLMHNLAHTSLSYIIITLA